jgi:hypothetical protein
MGKYSVTYGQNIFDVAMHIYGSIEGIVDLMMNNAGLSLASHLKAGDSLTFTDNFIINADTVAYFRMNHLTPANGERGVYDKPSLFPPVFKIHVGNKKRPAGFSISGTGAMDIDWGDNSPLQPVTLSTALQPLSHTFDNTAPADRKIRLYGDFTIKQADFTALDAVSILLLRPVSIEKFLLKDARLNIAFLSLMKGLYDIDLSNLVTDSLLPFLDNISLMRLNLSGAGIKSDMIDHYLIGLVKRYRERRSCTLTLNCTPPSGEYREPARDEKGNYLLSSGMEALWLLTNEPAWNEGGYWKCIINGEIYTTEK